MLSKGAEAPGVVEIPDWLRAQAHALVSSLHHARRFSGYGSFLLGGTRSGVYPRQAGRQRELS